MVKIYPQSTTTKKNFIDHEYTCINRSEQVTESANFAHFLLIWPFETDKSDPFVQQILKIVRIYLNLKQGQCRIILLSES